MRVNDELRSSDLTGLFASLVLVLVFTSKYKLLVD